ncbi:thioesterase family protein [Croceibacter atlanticus]|jgi:acyl-CoA thioester hydrolase|uniref:acyl-CoA thioesterase n=1 Tax=Croceibacter atlanticus TaxID=313588 RepID=UPI0030D8A2AA|tara:strand:+ start:45454 stop:45867 length:414 start_codon:yes stop_codon:yes gene_type:complete
MSAEKFPLTLTLRIDWSETDAYKHVNNVTFIKYMQSARVNFWEETGLATYHTDTNKGPMLVSTKCDFKQQLTYPGNVIIKTRVTHIGTTSFSLKHYILNESNQVSAIGQDVAVCFDFNTQKTFEIPDWLREKMEEFS